jgi:hypothetical protein
LWNFNISNKAICFILAEPAGIANEERVPVDHFDLENSVIYAIDLLTGLMLEEQLLRCLFFNLLFHLLHAFNP